jgi:phosphohistidine swiveling domain-containing protein
MTTTTATVALVQDLDALDAAMLATAGGKAANLGELIKAGLPVPPGFCVTTEAYRRMSAGAGLDGVLEELAATSARDVTALAALAGRARELVLATRTPAEVRDAISADHARLGDRTPVAVRSSATAEDLPFATFAGQQDTYLNVVGTDAVLDAVRRCWASLWTDRAVSYRATHGIDHRDVRLAVVIQRMVDAEIAGVMFTADPVTGRRARTVIDASRGLGESVVSGAVNPDHFVVDTESGEIAERRLGDKRVMIRSVPGGGTEHVEQPSTEDESCVTGAQLSELVALGRRVESHFGSPQDTEWAIDSAGALWLTQSRPIPTLYPLPTDVATRGLRVYFNVSLAQGLERPITPMGLAAFALLGSSVADQFGFPVRDPLCGPPVYAPAGQRIFVDMTTVLRNKAGRTLVPRVLDVMEARSAQTLRGLFDDPRLPLAQQSWWPFVPVLARVAARLRILPRAVEAVVSPEAALRRVDRIGDRLAAITAASATATPVQRLDLAERVLGASVVPTVPTALPPAAIGFAMLWLAGKVIGDDLEPGELQTVLRGLPHNVTTEMDLSLWRLAARIRGDAAATAVFRDESATALARRFRDGVLPGVAQDGLAGFLRRYGHRAVAEIDIGMPRWSDDPTHVLGVIANYLRLEDSALTPDAQFARGAADAEAATARLVAKARKRSRLRGRVVAFALRRTRLLAGLREMPKYYLVVALGQVRRQIAAVGAELAAKGQLDAPDDVFFLNLVEARAALRGTDDLRVVVAERKETYDIELRRRHIPRVLLSDGSEPEPRPAAEPGALVGTPASAGSVTGRARVLLDPVGAHLEPGEILVAPSTDPGWTPLFLTAGGLVMEMGGSNSHGAVVAREYGIPAVVGVRDAVSTITTGQIITVDGAAGTVAVREE